MSKYLMIRHGEPDYTYGDMHGFIGQGHDLAPLKQDKIGEVINTAKDERLKEAKVIITSPYTRALQTAAILSKELGLDIIVDPDVREWQPDLTFQYQNVEEMQELLADYRNNDGEYPSGQKKRWEQRIDVRERVLSALKRYKKFSCAIVVSHQMAIQSVCPKDTIRPAEIIEYSI